MIWQPIENLPQNWQTLHHEELDSLVTIWLEQRQQMEKRDTFKIFLERLIRKVAIETGVIERLYSIDRGVTQVLIEQGIDVALIPHGTSDKPAAEVVALVRDQQAAVEQVFNFVGSQRTLSTSFIKQLHQLLTKNQKYVDAYDQFGNLSKTQLLSGEWKKQPNNPTRTDGKVHYYCPPEQVDAQMDQLIQWHHEHLKDGVPPEIEAAWLHHRFTQIHPFQDGNGRVTRNLASLVLIKAGWFPLVILDDENHSSGRIRYLDALESADDGHLKPLVDLFAESQKRLFLMSLSLAEDVRAEASYQQLIENVVERIKRNQETSEAVANAKADEYGYLLFNQAQQRMVLLEREIGIALISLKDVTVNLDSAPVDDPRADWYHYQIIRTAKRLNYFANLNGHKSWIRLAIQIGTNRTEILLSFHRIGQQPLGLMACSACAYQRVLSEEGDSSLAQDIEPLAELPFTFTYQDDETQLTKRFETWLSQIIPVGVSYWQKKQL